jgi:hypothetical protein
MGTEVPVNEGVGIFTTNIVVAVGGLFGSGKRPAAMVRYLTFPNNEGSPPGTQNSDISSTHLQNYLLRLSNILHPRTVHSVSFIP